MGLHGVNQRRAALVQGQTAVLHLQLEAAVQTVQQLEILMHVHGGHVPRPVDFADEAFAQSAQIPGRIPVFHVEFHDLPRQKFDILW